MSLKYKHLDTSRAETRLLSLLPGSGYVEPQCLTHVASLDEKPEFEALSYVWGDASITTPIIVDDVPFQVTVNLDAALRSLRLRRAVRVLWIDAVCINQADVRERNHQVAQMGRIYRGANGVICWLGISGSNLEDAVTWALSYRGGSGNSIASMRLLVPSLNEETALLKAKELKCVVESLLDLLLCSYWKRMWTFQEYVLPQSKPLCACGHMRFDIDVVLSSLEAGKTALDKHLMKIPKWESKISFRDSVYMTRYHNKPNRREIRPISMDLEFIELTRKTTSQSLCYLLSRTSARRSLDPRDKVFALYELNRGVQQTYPADYSKPLSQVMLETATYIINHEKAGNYMYRSFGLRPSRLSDTSCPSWIPELLATDTQPLYPSQSQAIVPEPLYIAGDSPLFKVTDDHYTIRLSARKLATCTVALRFAADAFDTCVQIHCLLDLLATNRPFNWPWSKVRPCHDLPARLGYACMAQDRGSWMYDSDALRDALDNVFVAVSAGQYITGFIQPSSLEDRIFDVLRGLSGKTIIIESGGCFGICVNEVEDGDLVVLAPALDNPLVLRVENAAQAVGRKTYYRIVGLAYMDGIMDNACLDQALVDEIAEQKLEEFLIHWGVPSSGFSLLIYKDSYMVLTLLAGPRF